VLLYRAEGAIPPKMPKSVRLEGLDNARPRPVHLITEAVAALAFSGWGFPYSEKGLRVAESSGCTTRDGQKKPRTNPLKEDGAHFRRLHPPASKYVFVPGTTDSRFRLRPARQGQVRLPLSVVAGPGGGTSDSRRFELGKGRRTPPPGRHGP